MPTGFLHHCCSPPSRDSKFDLTFLVHNGEYPSAVILENKIVSKHWSDEERSVTATDNEENTVEASHYTDEGYTNVTLTEARSFKAQDVSRARQEILRFETRRLTHDNDMLIAMLQSE